MDDKKMTAKLFRYGEILKVTDIINFKGNTLMRGDDGLYHLMSSDAFARVVYNQFPGAMMAQIRELEHMFRAQAPDRTDQKHLIAMGSKVWSMRKLEFIEHDPKKCVFAIKTEPNKDTKLAWTFVTQLACGDELLAWDILQGIAPLFMERKPAGVIWFIGGGANGKSALVNAVYRIIGHHLASMTVKMIEDGKDTPRLNGMLGNICRESSEGRIDDTESYKAIGTHEPFTAHKFYSQDTITITGDLHHVFNANNIPVFADKTQGARRRTLIVPFNNVFPDDPTFEQRTFTPQFLAGLLELILQATGIIADSHFKYRFSEITREAKEDYDADVNSAEAFYEHLKDNKVEAFSGYTALKMAYESWCSNEGYVPLGVTQLKRSMINVGGARRKSVYRPGIDTPVKWYFFKDSKTPPADLVSLDNGFHIGLKIADIEMAKAPAPVQTKLGGSW